MKVICHWVWFQLQVINLNLKNHVFLATLRQCLKKYKPYNGVSHLNENTLQRTSSMNKENLDTVSSNDFYDIDYWMLSILLIVL